MGLALKASTIKLFTAESKPLILTSAVKSFIVQDPGVKPVPMATRSLGVLKNFL